MKKWLFTVGACVIVALVAYGGGRFYFVMRGDMYERRAQEHLREAQRIYAAIPVWHKKIFTQQIVKIGFITDTHVHPSRINKSDKRDDAPRYLESKHSVPLQNFIKHMRIFQPDFLVHGGDVIEGTNEKNHVGMQGLALVKKELDRSQRPVHWVLGNHDLRAVTKGQFLETLGQKNLFYAFDQGDYRFIILDGNKDVTLEELLADEVADEAVLDDSNEEQETSSTSEETDGDTNLMGYIKEDEIVWLKEQLATDKRVFVFCHYPLFTQQIYSADGSRKKPAINAAQLQKIFDEYRVDGVFAGHVEAQMYFQEGRTHYYTMTGTKKSKTYPGSYYDLTITGGMPDMTMYYTSPTDAQLYVMDFEKNDKKGEMLVVNP